MIQYHFEGLKVWQKSLDLVQKVYAFTKEFPKEELYGLVGQIRRASVSVPANIAEGKGMGHKKEELQFLHVARGSVFELIALIRVSQVLEYLNPSQAEEILSLANEVSAMPNGLIQSLR